MRILGAVATALLLMLLTLLAIPAFYVAYRKARAEGRFYGSFDEWLDLVFDC